MENGFSESSQLIPFNSNSKSHGLGRDGEIKGCLSRKKKKEMFFSSILGINWSTVSVTVCYTLIKSNEKCQRCCANKILLCEFKSLCVKRLSCEHWGSFSQPSFMLTKHFKCQKQDQPDDI